MTLLRVPVPTTTILAQKHLDPYKIAVLRSGAKHAGKLVLPGGRVQVGIETHLETGMRELKEEVGLAMHVFKFFCISNMPTRDVRTITIEKFVDGGPMPDELVGMKVEGYYCFDVAIFGVGFGEPKADGTEGVDAFWYDLRNLDQTEFALDHGRLAFVFKMYLETGAMPPLGIL